MSKVMDAGRPKCKDRKMENLFKAFNMLNIVLSAKDQNYIRKGTDFIALHRGYGMPMRNILHLWEGDNAKNIAAEIIDVDPNYLENFELTTDIAETAAVDRRLCHPDNCSYVLLRVYSDYLNDRLVWRNGKLVKAEA